MDIGGDRPSRGLEEEALCRTATCHVWIAVLPRRHHEAGARTRACV